eukprot:1518444-Pleurochrysis_carterae.AAC.1
MCGSGGCELAPRGHSKLGASPPHCCHDTVTATTALSDVTQENSLSLPHPAPANFLTPPALPFAFAVACVAPCGPRAVLRSSPRFGAAALGSTYLARHVALLSPTSPSWPP